MMQIVDSLDLLPCLIPKRLNLHMIRAIGHTGVHGERVLQGEGGQ